MPTSVTTITLVVATRVVVRFVRRVCASGLDVWVSAGSGYVVVGVVVAINCYVARIIIPAVVIVMISVVIGR